jgi:O-antigen/teichoic acid export membrane protein
MEIKIGKREYLWGYAGYFYRYGMRFFTIPFVWNYLDKAQLDIWFVFLSISSFVGLLDFGFSPNVVRAVTYAYGGTKELKGEGIATEFVLGGTNYTLLAALLAACKKVYALIAGVALIGLLSAGTYYLWDISPKIITPQFPFEKILPIWFIFVLSTVTDIYFKYIGVFIGARGLVGITQKFGIVCSLFGIALTFLVLYLGYGLLGTVIVSFLMTIATRLFYGYVLFDKIEPGFKKKLAEAQKSPEKPVVFRHLWHNSWRLGINSLGVFLIYQATVLLSGKLFAESYITQVGITLQVFNMLNIVSSAWFNISSPRYANLCSQGKMESLRREFLQAIFIGLVLYVIGFIAVFFLGDRILYYLGKDKVFLPGAGILLLYGAVYLSEIIHGKCATFILVKNIVPLALIPATLLTGVGSFLLSIVFACPAQLGLETLCATLLGRPVVLTGLGIASFPLAMLCAGLAYNTWSWPLRVIREFQFSFRDLRNAIPNPRTFLTKIVSQVNHR